jgi:hypothetical protein
MFYPICHGKIVVSTRLFSETAAQCHGTTTERYFADMRQTPLTKRSTVAEKIAKLALAEAGDE